MSHHRSPLTTEHFLYLALFVLALALRLYNLNTHPLHDSEAREALAVFHLINPASQPGETRPPSGSPAYFFFTYFVFLIFDASAATARAAPAMIGAALVFLPMLYRDRLGRAAALSTAALLALSAGLMAAARSADGAIIALAGLGFGLGALRQFRRTASSPWLFGSAAAFGLGLASGAPFLTGLVLLIVTGLAIGAVYAEERSALREMWIDLRPQWRTFMAALGLTLVLVVTVGLLHRRGLGNLAGSWATWASGFVSPGGRSPWLVLLWLFAYEPLVLAFGLLGAWLAFRRIAAESEPPSTRGAGRWLAGYAGAGLVYSLIYLGRSAPDALWVIVPLAALAGWSLADIVGGAWASEDWRWVAVQVGISLVLLTFAAFNLAAFAEQVRVNPDFSQGQFFFSGQAIPISRLAYLYLAGVALGLMLVVSYLFGVGWSPRAARAGLTLGAAVALLGAGVSAGWGVTQLRPTSPVELWWARPVADDLHRLVATLSSVSNYTVGNSTDVQVTAAAEPDGALAWALRDFPHATFVEALDASVASPVVIAPAEQANPALGSAYVGQAFAVRRMWAEGGLSWPRQIAWLLYRRAPVEAERVVLWVRQDVAQLQDAGRAD